MSDKSNTWLKVEHWYHIFVALGATGTVVSLSFDVKGITNSQSLLLCLGMLFVGIGEWINHPLQTSLMPPSIYAPGGGVITSHPRYACPLGVGIDLVGVLLLATALYKIIAAA